MHPTSLQFTALSNGLRADVARVYIPGLQSSVLKIPDKLRNKTYSRFDKPSACLAVTALSRTIRN